MKEKGNVLNIKDYFNKDKEELKISDECRILKFKEIKLIRQVKSIAKAYFEGRYDVDGEM